MTSFTLDQFEVFVAVVDCGGFAAAARKLDRAQSSITYAIKGLEEQSGLFLFDRSGYRPTLTDAGRALLPRARRLLADIDDYGREAEGFAKGLEADLTIVADEFVPLAPLTEALGRLRAVYPSVHVQLSIMQFKQSLEFMGKEQAHLGVLVEVTAFGSEFETARWGEHDLIAVASPSHPLANAPSPIPADALRDHMQLVWTPLSAQPGSPDHGVHALDRWHVTSLMGKLELLRAGIGWGSMPLHTVREDIEGGRLRQLNLQGWEGSDRMPRYVTAVVRRKDRVHGPAARMLFDALLEQTP